MRRDAGTKSPVNPWPHAIAFVFAAIGLVYFIGRFRLSGSTLAVMSVYGLGLMMLFGASSLYHALGNRRPAFTPVLQRIDHSSIYVLIAATYTPLLFFGLDGAWRTVTIVAVWILAVAGVILSTVFWRAPRRISTALYAAFGWAALVPAIKLGERLSHPATALILAGGVLYTLGAVVYATKTLNFSPGRFGFHEVFHCFVVAGAAMQFVAIAFYIAPPT